MNTPHCNPPIWDVPNHLFQFDYRHPLIMGIVNVTPDSFSDGGKFLNRQNAIEHGLQLATEGANILDVGGESTRPYAEPVSLEEELTRVIPIVSQLAKETETPISIDTTKAEVARQAIAAGATIVNDISGLLFDSEMPSVCAKQNVGVIVMHTAGKPQTMQDAPQYQNVVTEICDFFKKRIAALEEQGISQNQIVIDPGIGFGKTASHNLEILSNINTFRALGRPIMIGHSRKRFLEKVIGRKVDERLAGTLGVAIAVAQQGANILRVHDVQAIQETLIAWRTVAELTSEKK
ncbi:Dihydropteroate synthase [hydrothermal vent metagenome]|uniref:dihydropteroate synthase n=1 Tax=hydrothermal vent metagenome TaxID=652676 RepID=A0A3B1DF06_9ZZZZ